MSVQDKSVRILLVGDDGVGKTSLILSLVTEEFASEVPSRAEEITIPADVTPEKVPTHIVDFCQSEQTELELRDELERANVVCVVYAIDDDKSIEHITSYWLPLIFEVYDRDEEVRKPVVLVGNKADVMAIEGEKMQVIVDIMDEYPEIETCIECSALSFRNISELFYYAQKAVLHPTGPLFSNEEQALSEKCKTALVRIFKICDMDNDDFLNDVELNEFQKRCFKNALAPDGIAEVKKIVQQDMPEGVTNNGITLEGFQYLHFLFIQKGRVETTWTALRRFGYGNDLELRDAYLHPSLQVEDGCSVELSSTGIDFVVELFCKFDQDEDDALSPEELLNLERICPSSPWTQEMLTASCQNDQGWMTIEGFVAQWILWTYVNRRWTLEQLARFGFVHGEMENQLSALRVTRSKLADQLKHKSTRTVFHVCVIGESKVGKTSFLQSFVHKYVKNTSSDTSLDSSPLDDAAGAVSKSLLTDKISDKISKYAVNSVQLKRKEVHVILEEVSVEDALNSNCLHRCDVVCYLVDVRDSSSYRNVAAVLQSKPEGTPFLCIATKADLKKRQTVEPDLNTLIALHSQYPLQSFSSTEEGSVDRSVFTKIANLATRAYVGSYSSDGSFTKYFLGFSLTVSLLSIGGFLLYRHLKKGSSAAALQS